MFWEGRGVLSGYSILMDPGLFSHDQEGMGRDMESNDVSGSSIFLLAEYKDTYLLDYLYLRW